MRPILFSIALALSATALADDWKASVLEEAAPAEIAAFVKESLAASAIRVANGDDPVFDFWFVKELPLKAATAEGAAWENVDETAVLGAVRVHKDQRDYRDDDIFAGLYTMRYGLRPVDGDHQGTSDYRYFALLIPAEADQDAAAISDREIMVEKSAEDTPTEHPVILSIRPQDKAEDLPKITTPIDDHTAVLIKLPAKAAEGAAAEVAFELVIEGHGHL